MRQNANMVTPEVLVIGGGPAGLTAAARLAGHYHREVLVVDREDQAGGIPRHSDHTGYGLRDLGRFLRGPAYARRLVTTAQRAGATIRPGAMVTGWDADGGALVTSPQGRLAVRAEAVVLATGARERPRAARLIPGDRPAGVYTTGQLQNLVHLHHRAPGRRAVVVGGEPVSWSAVLTLREAGVRTVLMTTQYRSPESYAAFNLPGQLGLRVPVATRTRVAAITGRTRVEAVEIENLDDGARRSVGCDAVVFTGDWIPDHELARLAGVELDPGTRGPLVDTALRTSRPGVFAAGNLVHPADTADVAALDGRHAADQVAAWLAGQRPDPHQVRIRASQPLRWAAPGLLRPGDPAPARRRLLLWTDELVRVPAVTVTQGGQTVTRQRLPWPASPGRVFRVPWSVLSRVDPHGGDVTIGVRAR
jgi:thioredoxin reductase